MNKVQKWVILQEYYIIARPVGSSYLNFCHGDSTNIAVSEYRSLYILTVPDRQDSRGLRQDGQQRGWGVHLAEREQPEVGL